jgi:hypothetical protein
MHARVTADLFTGASLNLDFHSVPYFGEHTLVESHYLAKRSRRQPSILVFLAQDADAQVFCYANADIRKGEEADEIFRFIDFWKRQHGKAPQHLVFDSKLTTYAGLDRLDAAGITFLTLRRRSGYDDAQARQIFRDLIDMPAAVAITENEIRVRFHRRAHLPIVLASGLFDKPVKVPWWDGQSLRFIQ